MSKEDLEFVQVVLTWCKSKGIKIYFSDEHDTGKGDNYLYTVDPDNNSVITPFIGSILGNMGAGLKVLLQQEESKAVTEAKRFFQPKKG
jgi:hypothetical protein